VRHSGLQRCFWCSLLNVYRRFDSQSPVALECITLQLNHYSTSKSSWLPTSWLNDVRSHKTWVLTPIAVINRNVVSKQYCLLQVLVAAFLLLSCAAFVKKYPDLLDRTKYYLRIGDSFNHLTCPNSLCFEQNIQQCILNNCMTTVIMPLGARNCSYNMEGYYCETDISFTYCTHDGFKIIDNATCSIGLFCQGPPNIEPCVP